MTRHHAYRRMTRTTLRSPFRCSNRSTLRGRRRGPDDLSQALTAFGRAIRAHRRLARLAPRFFDAAVVDREALNRAEQRRSRAVWEPLLCKVYGTEPEPPDPYADLPRLPSVEIQQEVELKLAEREMCIVAGREAMERYRQRQPHAVMSWSRIIRLLKIGFHFGNLACGLHSPNPLPEKITNDYGLTDLKRAYGHEPEPPPVAGGAGGRPQGLPASRSASEGNGGASVPASHPQSSESLPSIPASGSGGSPQGLPANLFASEGNGGASVPASHSPSEVSGGASVPASHSPSAHLAPAAPSPPVPPRNDAWSRWARAMRRMRSRT